MEIIPYFLGHVIAIGAIVCERLTGNFAMLLFVVYVIIPILDFVIPHDDSNVPKERVSILEKDKRFLIPLYSYWLLDFASCVWLLNGISNGTFGQTTSSLILYALCGANIGSTNAAVGHELFHRKQLIHKIAGTLAYVKMLYAHSVIQHIRSHHKKVGTPEDPSTARLGESLFHFWGRVLPEGVIEVWNCEQDRLTKKK